MAELPVYEFDPQKLPADFLSALGLTIASAAYADAVIVDAIGALAGLSLAENIAITSHMTGPVRADVVRTLAEDKIPDLNLRTEFLSRFNRLIESLKKRHLYAHALWFQDRQRTGIQFVSYSARGSIGVRSEFVTVATASDAAAAMRHATLDVSEFLIVHGFLPDEHD